MCSFQPKKNSACVDLLTDFCPKGSPVHIVKVTTGNITGLPAIIQVIIPLLSDSVTV